MFEKIPIEVLAEIFSETTPKDLYCLTLVCKRVRIILWSSSELAQSIWRRSRLKHITHSTLQPPKDMTEQEYIWLMVKVFKSESCQQMEIRRLQIENIKYKELFDECRYSYIERAQRKLAILYHNRKVNG
ncbi:10272_t:CDS:2 [Entrophospora sp. SA101]|nr:10272_t:CDS:2 [Entrophospora sp. SA101]